MEMLNTNNKTKIVYALRIHLQLLELGFQPLMEMRNPEKQYLNCWVYEATPEFKEALNQVLSVGKGGPANGNSN